jgi:ABC-type branched-subunit amino acid transport system ATPase component
LFRRALAATLVATMKRNAILVVTSLLSILLLTLHVTDDIVRKISKVCALIGPNNAGKSSIWLAYSQAGSPATGSTESSGP